MTVKITFLGAAQTVTGSKYLVESGAKKILIDAGMFQGERRWREENWRVPDFKLAEINALLLTHAHVDHVGMLPRLWNQGLRCPVYCTKATLELARLILMDSAYLQEEEAKYRQQRGRSRHQPALPLYTIADARAALELLRPVPIESVFDIADGVKASWNLMGHILGACSIRLEIGGKVLCFSGDIGRYNAPLLVDPKPIAFGDLLLIESTYGDKLHPTYDHKLHLGEIINKTVKRKGIVVIPSFAVGRTQTLLYYLRELKEERRISDIPVIIDSPMANDATQLYVNNPQEFDTSAQALFKAGKQPFLMSKIHFIRDRDESIKLNSIDDPMILISASGMLSGGRILHHLRNRIVDPRNTILFVGHQPEGGRGAWIKSGAPSLRLMGEEFRIRAEIEEISGLSAHADQSELLRWCKESTGTPGKVGVVHGEPRTAAIFADKLRSELNWNVALPDYLQSWQI